MRIDADDREPRGGFVPVKVTYVDREAGQEKPTCTSRARRAEIYSIRCAAKPEMKSLALELAL